LVGITRDKSVLDVGGPARYLTERTGHGGQVSFQSAGALELPFGHGRFDAEPSATSAGGPMPHVLADICSGGWLSR